MAEYQTIIDPWLGATATPGNCLDYVQKVVGAPVANPSAWWAWLNAGGRHEGEQPPQAVVVLFFEHWGTYGPSWPLPRHFGNWGHTAVFVPGVGIYTSPANPNAGDSFEVYDSIAAIERAFNATYVGWVESLNGRATVELIPATPPPPIPEEDLMSVLYVRPTTNSSPTDPNDPKSARIWAGDDRKLDGATQSGTWAVDDQGNVRRLTMAEWRTVIGAYAAIGRPVPVATVHGNDVEILMYGPQAKK